MDQIWGFVLLVTGVLVSVYGTRLFSFGLSAMGFGLGFLFAYRLLEGQEIAARVLIALVVGGAIAAIVFSLARFALAIAGGILGIVLGVVVVGLFGLASGVFNQVLAIVLTVGGAVGGGVFGPRLGQSIVPIAASATGALLIVNGFYAIYADQLAQAPPDIAYTLGNSFTLALFVVLFLMGALGQVKAQDLRRRLIR
ncbi:MAG: hypothetical protein IT337_17535 [Thermomicrobiales bacterium]|nr:hypothetical protein [Thermomicrobiales bacterium]